MGRGESYWQAALERVATRVQSERGIVEPVSVTSESGLSWANYARLRFQIGGSYPDLESEAELWDEVDFWVAFGRPEGPGVQLDRDLEHAARWREKLDIDGPIWREAAARLAADLSATSTVAWTSEVYEEDEESIRDPADRRTGVWMEINGPPRRTRKLLLPRMNVRLGNRGFGLDSLEGGGLKEAVLFLDNAIGDELLEEFWNTAWPVCPSGDDKGLEIGGEADDPVWSCDVHGVVCPVGSLTPAPGKLPGGGAYGTAQPRGQ